MVGTHRYAQIAVDSAAPLKTYTYLVPPHLVLATGQAVWVPFGRGSAQVQGIVFGFTEDAPVAELKPVAGVIDVQPVLAPAACRLAEWLSDYYYTPLFECASLMMPPGFRQRVRTLVEAVQADGEDTPLSNSPPQGGRGLEGESPPQGGRGLEGESPPQGGRGQDGHPQVQREQAGLAGRVLAHVKERGSPIELGGLRRRFGQNTDGAVERLVAAGAARRVSMLPRASVGPRYVRRLMLTELGIATDLSGSKLRLGSRQLAVLAYLKDAGGAVAASALSTGVGTAIGAVSGLVKRGLVTVEHERMTRDPLAGRAFQESFPPVLTLHQEAVFRHINEALAPGPTRASVDPYPRSFLLYGVTGSGKTEVYLRALEACVATGRKGIVLVPEIALEPQTVRQFSARFPGRVAVLHSGVSPGEAYDEWWRIKAGEFDVVIGSRSAVFAPQPDLGLIVIDEEHEATYKQQDMTPRYDARRAAEERARLEGAVVVLGSATPDLSTYVAALHGKHRLLELPARVSGGRGREEGPETPLSDSPPQGGRELGETSPGERGRGLGGQTQGERGRLRGLAQVEVVDLRAELKAGNRSIFSRALQEGLGKALQEGSQAILFLNRRGSSTFVQCRDCGAVVLCRRCETPFTYHSAGERLICHQCNASRRVPSRCASCGSGRVRYLGVGTQRVEAEVTSLFPRARVLRWDRDTARNRRGHEEFLGQFVRREADVLVGTQMIAKGLDLPQVTVVGVVNADVNLYLPDFRAAERTFQLLTQVAGRAGRGELPGRVVIQTYTPDHYAIQAAARQDYEAFAKQEMAFRQRHGYPPAQPLIRVVHSGRDALAAQREAAAYRRALATERSRGGRTDVQVLGPLPGYFRRVRGNYRWQVLLKGGGARALLAQCPAPRGWVVDVDPLHIL